MGMKSIVKILHSYITRETNHDVGVQSDSIRLNLQFFKHEMILYRRISSLLADYVIRKSTLNANSLILRLIQGKRPHSRPRADWEN